MTGWTWYSLLSRNSQTRNLVTQNLVPALPYPNKKSGRLSPIHLSLFITLWTLRHEISLLETSHLLFLSYASYFLITSVAFVPPKPKLLDITVFNSTSRFSVTISRPLAASSRFSMLILGATKPCSSISVE